MTNEERQAQLDSELYKKKSYGREKYCSFCWACCYHTSCIADPRLRTQTMQCVKAEDRMKAKTTTRKKGVVAVTEEYMNGVVDPKKIAKRTGFSLATVKRYMQVYNLGRKRPYEYNGKMVSERTLQIIKLIEAGAGLSEIARQYGISRQMVHQIKNRYLKKNWNDK